MLIVWFSSCAFSLSDHHHIIIKKIELKKAEAIKRLIKINRGWFIQSIYGEETDRMLWLLIQHMDSDIAYQKYILNILKKLYPIGETSKQKAILALLVEKYFLDKSPFAKMT